MTNYVSMAVAGLMVAGLAACGGGSTGGGNGGGGGTIIEEPDEPTPPSISASTVANARSFIGAVSARRDTPALSILPGGTATYTGEMTTGLTVNGEPSVNGLIGDVSMTAQLFGAGDQVTGRISNVHTLAGNTPVERLGGSLNINGTLQDGSKVMSSRVTGQLSGVLGDGERGAIDVTGNMTGTTQDTRIETPIPLLPPIVTYDEATGLAGTVSGSLAGSETGTFSGSWAVSE